MLACQSLKKLSLVRRRAHGSHAGAVLTALHTRDPDAALLALVDAWVSRDIVARLWESLPDESSACVFPTEEALTTEGARLLPAPLDTPVVLHLGWETFCVRTTLDAAWYTWPAFCHSGTEAYNACVYPESLEWYIVRAGTSLYPMECLSGAEPAMRSGC